MMPDVIAKTQPPKPQVSDGKITKTQKSKIHAYNLIQTYLGFRFSEDFEGKNGAEIGETLVAAIAAKENSQSESKIMMLEAFDIEIGGETMTVKRLPFMAEAGIRKKIESLLAKASSFVGKQGITLETITDQEAIQKFIPFLINEAWDAVLDVFWHYAAPSGIMREEQEKIILYDEMVHAVVSLLEVVIPFFAHQGRRVMGSAKGIGLALPGSSK